MAVHLAQAKMTLLGAAVFFRNPIDSPDRDAVFIQGGLTKAVCGGVMHDNIKTQPTVRPDQR
jgi:hypothetical protein